MSSPSAAAAAEDYAALMRGDLTISDVTSDEGNAEILRRLKDEDPEFTKLWLRWDDSLDYVFDVYDTRGLGVLGCFVGRSANVKELIVELRADLGIGIIEPFLLELQNNRSIETLHLIRSYIPRDFYRMLAPFIASNLSLVKLEVDCCRTDAEQYRSLSLALSEGKSLKDFSISPTDRYDHEESITAIIEALKMHPQLECLEFVSITLGRNACVALSDLLRQSAAGMRNLSLCNNDIDDTRVDALVDGLAHCRALTYLNMSDNPNITVRGWRAVSTLLKDPDSNLETFHTGEPVNDEIAILFANALTRNSTLETLYFDAHRPNITSKGWGAFSKVLCDTTSVNNTFLSNHKLREINGPDHDGNFPAFDDDFPLPGSVRSLLTLNGIRDKKMAAFAKVLQNHEDFDMQPLFEWDLKVLPFVVEWFEIAAVYEIETEEGNQKRNLAAIYQFIRGMPELAIDGIAGANKKSANVGGEKRPHSTAFEG